MRISDWCSDVCSSDLLRISVSAKAVEQQCVTEYPRHEELTSGSIAAQDADGCAGKVAGRLFGQPDCDLLVRRRHDCHEGTRLHGGRAAGAHFGGQVEIARAHVFTPVTNAQLECRLRPANNKQYT